MSDAPLLEVVDLSFTHLGQTQPTLKGVNLTLQPGELVVLAGATGSGKSTLLNCLTGIAPEHTGGKLSGQIFCQGQEITEWSIRARSQHMGILLQNVETQIFTDRVWEELVFGLENWNLPPGEIQAIAQFSLTEFDLVDQRDWSIRQLSAGQKQRLLLTCLLTRQPKMLLLDEPFAFLDTAGVQLLLELLQERVAQGQTVLLIEHRLELLEGVCDGRLRSSSSGGRPVIDHRIYKIESGQVSLLPSLQIPVQPVAETQLPSEEDNNPVVLQTENLSWGDYPPFPDLQVRTGDIVLLKGENGCGKTTLLKLLSGLLKPNTGRLEISGQDVMQWSVVQISRSVGFILQNPNHQLFAESVEAEVMQPGVEAERAKQLLEELNLSHCAQKHPHALSQGQKRRLALGAVLARQPKICLLDEIMVGQDATSLELMLSALKTFTANNGTLIFTSHDPSVTATLNPQVFAI